MKLRLTEEFSVQWNTTLYKVERHAGGWFEHWRLVNSYSKREDAEALFGRFKEARGEHFVRKVLDEWPSQS